MSRKILLCLILAVLAISIGVFAQTYGSKTAKSAGNVSITAKLVNEDDLAKDKMALIQVAVTGVTVSEIGFGHLGVTHKSTAEGTTGTSGMSGTGSAGTTEETKKPGEKPEGTTSGTTSGAYGSSGTGSMGTMKSGSNVGAHIHYQLDNGPVVATYAKMLAFADLSSGSHTITVYVVDGSHNPISEKKVLNVNIP